MFSGDNLLYLLTMLEAIEKVERYTMPFDDAQDFFQKDDQLHFHASSHLLLAIGEESKYLEKPFVTNIRKYLGNSWLA